MLRFAPSPTRDMNISDLRIALFNYLLCVQKDEGLIVRIEDTDKEKNIKGKDQEIIGLLDLFGIKYTNVIYQSDNVKHHRTMALSLLHEKIAFNCFCTPSTLEDKRKVAQSDNRPYRYDDRCLSLSPEQTIDNESPFTVRLRKPSVNVEFNDAIKGKMSFSPMDIDSFIILHADKNPTYNYACAIDDMLADISMVIRDEDHLFDTPKQIAVRAALNYTKEIEYAHLPLLLNDSAQKMGEKDEAGNLKYLLEEGFIPEAIMNYLIFIGNTTPQEIFTMKEALEWFDLSKISKEAVLFDLNKLRFFNSKHLSLLDDIELSRYVGFADADIGKLAKLYLEEVSTTKELKAKIAAIFSEKEMPKDFIEAANVMKPVIQNAPYYESFDEFKSYIKKETGLEGEFFSQTLRVLLTGASNGPKIEDMYAYLKNYIVEIVK